MEDADITTKKKRKATVSDSEDDISDADNKKQEKTKASVASTTKKAASAKSGENIFELGGRRKVTVSAYKGTTYVNIREFYEDKATGEEKPGAKGIALNKEQWKRLVAQIGEIEDCLK